MSRDIIYIRGIWTQRKVLVGRWTRRRMYLLAFLGMLVLTGAAFLTPGLLGAVAKAKEDLARRIFGDIGFVGDQDDGQALSI